MIALILGISASGRNDGVTSETVKAVLKASELEYEYISLAGKQINGCIGCTACAADNTCKVQDDWNEIGEKMREADAIVFGAPNYFGRMNALGHAFWERAFCFRHQEVFSLAGKLGVIVSVEYEGNSRVKPEIEDFMSRNKMVVVESVFAKGSSQCFTCGYGHDCGVGNVVRLHGFIEKVEDKHLPPCFSQQEEAKIQAYKAGKILGSILGGRNTK
ncbi:MAG: NADPH-dependent reductase [Anaerosporomusa subterranea]|nr:NADPH-dependent reductase [Anaerosporomusa subterranea]